METNTPLIFRKNKNSKDSYDIITTGHGITEVWGSCHCDAFTLCGLRYINHDDFSEVAFKVVDDDTIEIECKRSDTRCPDDY